MEWRGTNGVLKLGPLGKIEASNASDFRINLL